MATARKKIIIMGAAGRNAATTLLHDLERRKL